MSVAVDYSVVDKFLPEPCEGSNSKVQRLQTTAKHNRRARTKA